MLHAIKNFFRRLFGRPVSRKRKRTIVMHSFGGRS